ncbi:hypothetical protein L596_009782 [Steinernema carpocapsae]|uniref:Uncharacterized protein n=1 Tax=Steinernema carpocapsae TaxID=34508 RepID=A0A4U5PGC1_STECR|nr:hypothetical protein L596_009782 [Steinernema carpocapsae]
MIEEDKEWKVGVRYALRGVLVAFLIVLIILHNLLALIVWNDDISKGLRILTEVFMYHNVFLSLIGLFLFFAWIIGLRHSPRWNRISIVVVLIIVFAVFILTLLNAFMASLGSYSNKQVNYGLIDIVILFFVICIGFYLYKVFAPKTRKLRRSVVKINGVEGAEGTAVEGEEGLLEPISEPRVRVKSSEGKYKLSIDVDLHLIE